MKPVLFFGATFVFLLGGTFAGRYTSGAGSLSGTESLSPFADKPIPFTGAGAISLGDFSLEEGERGALRCITAVLTAQTKKIIAVEWFEVYHGYRRRRRAQYAAETQILTCETRGDFYCYAPVTQEGMQMALARKENAPFANAHLYSLPRIAAR